ncbi:MAG: hypothetical protein ACRCT1_22160 [Microcoleaceae cyanobacterium]|jgi:hypothetical protein
MLEKLILAATITLTLQLLSGIDGSVKTGQVKDQPAKPTQLLTLKSLSPNSIFNQF